MRRGVVIPGVLLALSLAACDLVVGPGETLTLGGGGQVLGSPGNEQRGGNIAVDVATTGRVVVEDADVFGGDDATVKPDPTGAGSVRGGAAIRAQGAQVTLRAGTIVGGDALPGRASGVAGNGIDLTASTLRVEGGLVRAGRTTRGTSGRAVVSRGSRVELAGGSIEELELQGSTAVVSGGSLGAVIVEPFPPDLLRFLPGASNCLEISGGLVRGPLSIQRASTDLFVRGTGFNLPFGEVTAPDPIPLVGRLVDGSPLAAFVFRGSAGSRVFLIEDRGGVSASRCPPRQL